MKVLSIFLYFYSSSHNKYFFILALRFGYYINLTHQISEAPKEVNIRLIFLINRINASISPLKFRDILFESLYHKNCHICLFFPFCTTIQNVARETSHTFTPSSFPTYTELG